MSNRPPSRDVTNPFRGKETPYGFEWGPLKVERIMSHPKYGVVIDVSTRGQRMEIRATPKGRRLFFEFKEPKP